MVIPFNIFQYLLQANLARWEPAHGHFKLRHPWNQYLKVGTAMRYFAYSIEALSGFINSDIQVIYIN